MIKVLVAEDMRVLREALISLLKAEPDLEVVGSVDCGTEVSGQVSLQNPDVLILDVRLPDIDGITVARQCREQFPALKIVFLTAMDKPGVVREALRIGVHGFLPKGIGTEDLVGAIRRVHKGERVVSAELVSAALEKGENPLTPRERTVLREIARGRQAAEIAAALNLAEGTVRNNITAAIGKVSARNAIDAVRIAEQFGWL